MVCGIFDGPGHGGMLLPLLPCPLKPPELWNARQAAAARPAGIGLEHIAPSSTPLPPSTIHDPTPLERTTWRELCPENF